MHFPSTPSLTHLWPDQGAELWRPSSPSALCQKRGKPRAEGTLQKGHVVEVGWGTMLMAFHHRAANEKSRFQQAAVQWHPHVPVTCAGGSDTFNTNSSSD